MWTVAGKKALLFKSLPPRGKILEIGAGAQERVPSSRLALAVRLPPPAPPTNTAHPGIGAGPNLKFYDSASHVVTGLDPNPWMLEKTLERAQAGGHNLNLVEGRSEALPFADATFDAVVATLVLCSVKDTSKAVAEIGEMERRGGSGRP